MTEHEEALANLRANFDQAKSATSEVAKLLAAYFNELRTAGFKREEALALVRDYQNLILGGNASAGGDET